MVIGGLAAVAHGSAYLTRDLDICYARDPANLERLSRALQCLLGDYSRVNAVSEDLELEGEPCRVLGLDGLIAAKRASGRPKDLALLAELEALRSLKRPDQ